MRKHKHSTASCDGGVRTEVVRVFCLHTLRRPAGKSQRRCRLLYTVQLSPADAHWQTPELAQKARPAGCLSAVGTARRTLVHTQLSSSAAYWGAGSLDEDAEELNLLAQYLRQHHASVVPARCPAPPAWPATRRRTRPHALI